MNESRTKLTLYGVFSKSCIISPRQTNASRKQTQNTNTQIIIGDIFCKIDHFRQIQSRNLNLKVGENFIVWAFRVG